MIYVLDASLIVAALVEEAETAKARPVAAEAQTATIAPPHLYLEVANALTMKFRRKLMTALHRDTAFETFGALNITVDKEGDRVGVTRRTLALADAHSLTLYDAAYLELAIRSGATLGTLDRDLRRAALTVGITVLPV